MIHILTLNWNGESKLSKLYETLIPNLKTDYKWYIKDNASKDNSVNLVKSWNNSNVHLFNYANNIQNFSEGMNYLFSKTDAKPDDFILLLNNDIIFNDDSSLDKMISCFTDNVGAVGARLLYTGSNRLQHAGIVFDPIHNKIPKHYRLNEESDDLAIKNRQFQVVTGAVMLTKAKYYQNICVSNKSGINGLNESYHWAFDDVDACLSIKYNMNKDIIYCGETNIFHEESASLKKNPANKLFMAHNMSTLRNTWSSKIKLDTDLYKNSKYGEI